MQCAQAETQYEEPASENPAEIAISERDKSTFLKLLKSVDAQVPVTVEGKYGYEVAAEIQKLALFNCCIFYGK